MAVPEKEYEKMAKRASPPSPNGLNCLKAFWVGGTICMLGQGLSALFGYWGIRKAAADLLVSLTLIVLTAILTGCGVFDRIAKHAGAGTIVPITGFANAVVSPAMEYRSEGHILGTGAEMFRIAGPVIVYGSAAAVVYGLICYFMR